MRSASDAVEKSVIRTSVIAKWESLTCRIETARKSAASSPILAPPILFASEKSTMIVIVPAAATTARAETANSPKLRSGLRSAARCIHDSAV